jgi:hypothetical protein
MDTIGLVNLQVEMWPGGVSAGADDADDLAGGDLLPDNNIGLDQHVTLAVDDGAGSQLGAHGHGRV